MSSFGRPKYLGTTRLYAKVRVNLGMGTTQPTHGYDLDFRKVRLGQGTTWPHPVWNECLWVKTATQDYARMHYMSMFKSRLLKPKYKFDCSQMLNRYLVILLSYDTIIK